ncbi:MAG: glucose-6-phosphate dehydrogenase [Phycisphaeraceae bacterium]|nr:glucose-6-phosphate dehydrogenase [Phycisphaeraceae bacterium]
MPNTERIEPCLIVIFGASGDLTKRKLIPALFDLYRGKHLSPNFAVLGISRTEWSDDAFREHLKPWALKNREPDVAGEWDAFARQVYYHAADSTQSHAYPELTARIAALARKHNAGQSVLFYLSMAPQLYESTIEQIGAAHMVMEGKAWCSINRDKMPWQRIIVEKPFGHDPQSANQLNRVLGRVFEEENIYRIDHYLGKETVQNLLVFRFANTIFEPIWNRNYVDHVQVTAMETVGVEGRGGYYDSPSGGAMRDMIQSHLMQVMALVAMEPPVSMRADDIRNEKVKVFQAVRKPSVDHIAAYAIRGQYGRGSMEGQAVPAYREEQGVSPSSQTDTYAAIQLYVDTWRWGGVPFYLRSGKRMAKKMTEIVITFRPTPHCLFRETAAKLKPNQIIINVQPDEGIRLRFEGKVPGTRMDIRDVVMSFDYVSQFKGQPQEAYARMLLDAMRGDQTLFKHRDEVESSWNIVQPVLDAWADQPHDDLPNYAAGTWGPSASDVMMARDNRHWHNP